MKLYTEIIALCDYATISREGKLSMNGIFDEVRVAEFPGGIARAYLVASLHGLSDKPYTISIKLVGEKGIKVLQHLDMDIRTGQNGKHNMIFELVNLGFEKEGEYRFVIYHDKQEIGATSLIVMHQRQEKKVIGSLPN